MLTKNHYKLIRSLRQKKQRQKQKLFVAEGVKVVQEFLNSKYELEYIFSTSKSYSNFEDKWVSINNSELKKISSLVSANSVLAIFKIPKPEKIDFSKLIIALDELNNPGNLGTIIRLCDWYGVKDLICSKDSVDCYNPKVIQSAMGSHSRLNISYLNLKKCLNNTEFSMGADLSGDNIYNKELPQKGILIFGNESNGISPELYKLLNIKLTIPRFGKIKKTESLNVANAVAIMLSEFKRRTIEM